MGDMHVVVVFDDLRTLPPHSVGEGVILLHCRTEEEFISTLDTLEGASLELVLDHDLGGEAFGPITARRGIRTALQRHRLGRIHIELAFVVTANPQGGDWIVSELKNHEIKYIRDPFGRSLAMDQGY